MKLKELSTTQQNIIKNWGLEITAKDIKKEQQAKDGDFFIKEYDEKSIYYKVTKNDGTITIERIYLSPCGFIKNDIVEELN